MTTDYQCARCGSSLDWDACATCEATMDLDAHGYGHAQCPTCGGSGRMATCLSTAIWCEANPLPGRDRVERHTPEAFEIEEATS